MVRESHKKTIFYLATLISLCFLGTDIGISQPTPSAEKGPEIGMGEVTVRLREFESTPPFKILELQIEILNKSRKSVAPSHSITVVVTPKEAKFSSTQSRGEWTLPPQETLLDLPLPPNWRRVLMIGYPFHEESPESVIFDVQINPPEGEKKTVTWEKR